MDYKRRAANRQIPTEDIFFDELADQSLSTESSCLETLVREKLLHSCKRLKPPYDEIAMDYFYEELSIGQMADKLKRNEKTVQTQVYRAKAMLRKIYGRE